MKSRFRKLSSLKITLAGMVMLAIGASLSYGNPHNTPIWVLVVPMAVLAVNLVAAIATNPRINRQPGLLVFHVCLLLILVLVTIGRFIHLDAHIEMVQGSAFDPGQLMEVNAGPLHAGSFRDVHFIQGPYTVEYAAGLRRGLTHSFVKVETFPGVWQDREVGDDRPLVINGYRFYTTFNKGFAPILTWQSASGEQVKGVVHMPSYPLFDYKQDNRWTPPGTQEDIRFWLQLDTGLKDDADWILDGRTSSGVLVVTSNNARHELKVGESIGLHGGTLHYEGLTTWMGYRIFYDPTIQWLFVVAVTGVLGLAHYFWRKTNLQAWMDEAPDPLSEDFVKPADKFDGQTSTSSADKLSAPMATGDSS